MTIKPEVLAAIDLRFTSSNSIPVERASIRDHEWQTIRAELLAMDAEIVGMNNLWEMMTNLAVKKDRHISAEQASHSFTRSNRDFIESRLAAADALLRRSLDHMASADNAYCDTAHAIRDHLSEPRP